MVNVLHVASFVRKPDMPSGAANSAGRIAARQALSEHSLDAALLNVGDWRIEKWDPDGEVRTSKPCSLQGLWRLVQWADVVHFNAVYPYRFLLLAAFCRLSGSPYVISPRGNLTKRSQIRGRIKKTVANMVFFHWFVRGAERLHFLNEGEANMSFRLGRPYTVVPNETAVPDEYSLPPGSPVVFGFMGRFDVFCKGLDLLLEGVASARAKLRDEGARVVIVGSDHRGGRDRLGQLVDDHGIGDLVRLGGPVAGDERERFFQETSVFVHTSRWEGMPLAVLEALARGRPCLLTPGTNMAEVVREFDIGWVATEDPASIASALCDIVEQQHRLPEMGRHARTYAEEAFLTDRELRGLIDLYRSLDLRI